MLVILYQYTIFYVSEHLNTHTYINTWHLQIFHIEHTILKGMYVHAFIICLSILDRRLVSGVYLPNVNYKIYHNSFLQHTFLYNYSIHLIIPFEKCNCAIWLISFNCCIILGYRRFNLLLCCMFRCFQLFKFSFLLFNTDCYGELNCIM